MLRTYFKFIARLSIILFISISLSACTNQESEDNYKELIEQAREYYQDGQYADAVNSANRASRIFSARPESYEIIGQTFAIKAREKDISELLETAQKELTKDELARINYKIGQAYYSREIWGKAADYFKQAYELENSIEGVRFYLLSSSLKSGREDFDKGLLNRNESGNLEDDFADLKNLYKEKQPEDLYERTLKARGYIIEGYPFLAVKSLKDQQDALDEYDDGKLILARAYHDLRRYDNCIETLNSYTSSDYEGYRLLGRCAFESDNRTTSDNAYIKAYRFAEGEEKLKVAREYLEIKTKGNETAQIEQMIELVTADVQMTPQPLWLVTAQLSLYASQSNAEKVSASITEGSGLVNAGVVDPKDRENFYVAVIGYYLQKDMFSELETVVNDFEEYDNANPELLYAKALLARENGDKEAATNLLIAAIDHDLEGDVTAKAERLLSSTR